MKSRVSTKTNLFQKKCETGKLATVAVEFLTPLPHEQQKPKEKVAPE